ncbi:receptor-like protein kinase HSL1 [Zingiber officinale]|uniref:receptor-like protein kinase HSL1 n=1 Tax=Zingiber officinale TaxID=94328 RepID=UPI001C4B8571|nr:receptor-like protein kinase HSL1 [Zingiber officinale]
MHASLLSLLCFVFFISHLSLSLSLNQEGRSLLLAKSSLSDPYNALSDWNPADSTPCDWTGVTCSSDAVTAVDLSNFGLSGTFPSALCRLPHLTFLSLSNNELTSTLSSSALRGCSALSHLDLSQNQLLGPLPAFLPAFLPVLLLLDFTENNFSGEVPASFGQFASLQSLSLVGNQLIGSLPSFLANLSSLRELNLSYNYFAPSPIPPTFANLTQLRVLWLAGCNLVGRIPPELGHLSSLVNLDLTYNSLTGSIPQSLAGLSSAVQIELYSNSLSGPIPSGFSNLTQLRFLDASMNKLSGCIPDDIFLAPSLENLQLYENNLVGQIPRTISRCKNLMDLRLFSNRLTGSLPADFGMNCPLSFLDLSDNFFSGEIPEALCGGSVLAELLLLNNSFSGRLPESLGRCRTLTRVRLPNNRLSGEVPSGFWGLPHLWLLELSGNSFFGSISPAISTAANLSMLLLSDNQFSGSIPEEIGSLSNMYEFSAANNRFSGPLPASMQNLFELGELDLHNNSLSGELLRGIHLWKKLSQLNLADNEFSGSIPSEIGDLPVLNYLDLSGNQLSGVIPIELQNLKLIQFNLSNNQLSGGLPPLLVAQGYQNSFLGNPGLCGDLFTGLCPRMKDDGNSGREVIVWLLRSLFVLLALVLVLGAIWFYRMNKNPKTAQPAVDKLKLKLTSFHKLVLSENEILNCLDEDNVIGTGASGRVYRVVLASGDVVAVKKLWGTSKKNYFRPGFGDSFEAEVATLGKIRHKNIVKLWCCCTHNDCKLLVYEYMPNGSLGDKLHGSKGAQLDWPMRLKIAVDAAEGLSYLHHDCEPPIVHRDVKSNNILLDAEFGAKVADFGLAKAIEKGPQSMSVVAGSCGYIAPEYAYTLRVTEKSDIYSFGVVLLELVTGRFPVDPEFGEKDLVKWVFWTIEQKGVDSVIDPRLHLCFKEEIRKAINIGRLCTASLPINRPSMRAVVKMLIEVAHDSMVNPSIKDPKLV